MLLINEIDTRLLALTLFSSCVNIFINIMFIMFNFFPLEIESRRIITTLQQKPQNHTRRLKIRNSPVTRKRVQRKAKNFCLLSKIPTIKKVNIYLNYQNLNLFLVQLNKLPNNL